LREVPSLFLVRRFATEEIAEHFRVAESRVDRLFMDIPDWPADLQTRSAKVLDDGQPWVGTNAS
jgi:hypothetical protein